jgi:hypothetical protein
VAGVTPLPVDVALLPCGWPFTFPFALEPPLRCCPSFSEDGGVNSPAPPGKDSDAGPVKALACSAVLGCVVSESIVVTR